MLLFTLFTGKTELQITFSSDLFKTGDNLTVERDDNKHDDRTD